MLRSSTARIRPDPDPGVEQLGVGRFARELHKALIGVRSREQELDLDASLRRVSAPSGGGFGDPAGSGYALLVGHAAQSAELYDVYVSADGRNDSALRRVWIMQLGRESAYGPRCNA